MKFVAFSNEFIRKSNDRELDGIAMIFEEPLVKEYLTRPHFYEYCGNYVRLTLLENDKLSFGSVFDEPEDDTIFLDRKKLIQLLDQLEELIKQKFRIIYLIDSNGHLEFTSKFPTKYVLFLRCDKGYKLIEYDDPDLKLLADFLLSYKKSHTHEKFLKDERIFIKKVDWPLSKVRLKGLGNEVILFNKKKRQIKIQTKVLKNLMTEWQKLLKENPEKIYLLLENGEYRLTTDYTPE